jgi:hypothetical protein
MASRPAHDRFRFRPIVLGLASAALAFTAVASPAGHPPTAAAAACVRFSASNFDAPGNDNYSQYLNGEWVRIKNYCSTTKTLSYWTIRDYGSKHVYKFPYGVRIRPGYTITLYSGRGTNTSTRRYWQRTYGAVWNNTPPEYAYLRNAAGTQQSRWTEY